MKNSVIIFCTTAFFCFTLPGIQAQDNEAKLVSNSEKTEVIESISKILNENYVFPDIAEKMTSLLKKNLETGALNDIDNPGVFANTLTEILQSVSHDKHLRVRFGPGQVAAMREHAASGEEGPSDESLNMAKFQNFGFQEVSILDGNIGYLDLRGFMHANLAGETAVAAMNFLSNTNAIIIDLRNNGGGSPTMIQLISSYLFDGGDPVHLNNFYWRPEDLHTQTWTLPHVEGKRMGSSEVYILTSQNTFSAAEEFTYNLKHLERATVIGETTGGGAHPGGTNIATDRFMVWVPSGRAINPITNTNWEGTGVEPHIKVHQKDALSTAHFKALESLVKKEENEGMKDMYAWHADGLKAKINPVKLDAQTMISYSGTYGPRQIIYTDGNLYYQREGRSKFALIPISEDILGLEGMSSFRLKILKKEGRVVGLKGMYDNGHHDISMKDKT